MRARQLLRRAICSGWIPAVLATLATAAVVHHVTYVAWRDLAAFTLWFLWAHTVPGTVMWKVVDWRTRHGTGRPLIEDLTLGSGLGIVLGVPLYLVLTALHHPRWVLLWPLLVLVIFLAWPRARRRVLRRQPTPTPPWFSVAVALLVVFSTVSLATHGWSALALTNQSLRAPYVDEPYHLALVAEFKYHVPADFPYVAGTPLKYHWMVYPFLAMGTWGSGVEPIVLLRVLGPLVMSGLIILGLVAGAARLSGHRWAGIAAAVVVTVLSPVDVFGWTPDAQPLLGQSWTFNFSPTQTFANALAPLLVVLVVGLLRGAATRWWHWALTAVAMLVMAGAKSAMLPLFVAATAGSAVILLVLRQRGRIRTTGLAAMTVVVFLVASPFYYGRGSRSLSLSPFQATDTMADHLGLVPRAADGHASGIVTLTLAIVVVLGLLSPYVGVWGLLWRGGWRRATPWVALGIAGAAVLALLALRHPGLGQYYFLFSAVVPLGILSGVGLARALGPVSRATCSAAGLAVLLGLGTAYAVAGVTSHTPVADSGSTDAARMLTSFVVPGILAGLVVSLLVVLLLLARRRSPRLLRLGIGPLLVAVVVGMCLPQGVDRLLTVAADPAPVAPAGSTQILPGGISAARWLRDHSRPDDVVATNAHTRIPAGPVPDYRHFWISGYAERRVLVEGWAYVPPELDGLPSDQTTNLTTGPPFWDRTLLEDNDRVFTDPTTSDVEELRDTHHVRWLFVDLTRGADVEGLDRVASRRVRRGHFAVYELRP